MEVDAVAANAVTTDREPPFTPPDLTKPTRVLLVRHGVSAFTEQSRLDGRGGADPELSERGLEQARLAGQGVLSRLEGPAETVQVVTSSLRRAQQTGAAVADALGVATTMDAEWDEQDFGEWDGLRIAEILGSPR